MTHTGRMDNGVHTCHGFIKAIWLGKVLDVGKVELVSVLRSRTPHFLGLSLRTRRSTDTQASAEQLVDDVSTDEAGRSGHQNILSMKYYLSETGECDVKRRTDIARAIATVNVVGQMHDGCALVTLGGAM